MSKVENAITSAVTSKLIASHLLKNIGRRSASYRDDKELVYGVSIKGTNLKEYNGTYIRIIKDISIRFLPQDMDCPDLTTDCLCINLISSGDYSVALSEKGSLIILKDVLYKNLEDDIDEYYIPVGKSKYKREIAELLRSEKKNTKKYKILKEGLTNIVVDLQKYILGIKNRYNIEEIGFSLDEDMLRFFKDKLSYIGKELAEIK